MSTASKTSKTVLHYLTAGKLLSKAGAEVSQNSKEKNNNRNPKLTEFTKQKIGSLSGKFFKKQNNLDFEVVQKYSLENTQ